MKIKFIEVGRNNQTWDAECSANSISELEYDWLYDQVKRNAYVRSNDLEFLLHEDETNGVITAGFHTIGKFQIIKE